MAKKITYLLGAGASANTIPVVADMHERISEINDYLKSCIPSFVFTDKPVIIPLDREGTLEEITKEFDWLLDESKQSNSIDTLAKQYYLSGDHKNSYERLKKCLIIFFTIEQFFFIKSEQKGKYIFEKSQLDKRYDSFIASIGHRSDGKLKLNNNIRILSWNYDLQFELALRRFIGKTINEIKRTYQIFPLLNERTENNNGKYELRYEDFMIRKLNGNAVFSTGSARLSDEDFTIFDKYDKRTTEAELLTMLLDDIKRFDFDNNIACRYFNFSWEALDDFEGRKYDKHKNNFSEAQKIAEETEILVVIGYSFPIFNREIDNKLFNNMKNLEKVYIQDKNPKRIESTMRNAFKYLQEKVQINIDNEELKVETSLEEYTDQFVIPYELRQE